MSPLLLLPLDDVLTWLTPVGPGWVVPSVFACMTVTVTTLMERRAQAAALHRAAAEGAEVAAPLPAVLPAMARAIAGDASSDPAMVVPVDLRAELLGALSEAQQDAERGAVRLEVAIPHGLAPQIAPALLRPALLPLLRNAIDHTPGGRVFVGAMRAEGRVRIIIIDDGKQATRPLAAGVRAVLARLLARSDAALVVDHRPGDGTTVMLCLPGEA
jgi:hypothetical protein